MQSKMHSKIEPRITTRSRTSAGFRLVAGALCALLAALPAWAGEDAPPEEPPVTTPHVEFRLSEAWGRAGETVSIELRILTDVAVQRIRAAINFDETKLRLESLTRAIEGLAPADEGTQAEWDNSNEEAGDQATEGWIRVDLSAAAAADGLKVAVGQEVVVYDLRFRILADAPEGPTPVAFAAVGEAAPLPDPQNAVEFNAVDGVPAAPFPVPVENLKDGFVIILGLGEVGFFLRADTNLDKQRDISDPIRTLQVLFSGEDSLPCDDAADANDDGKIDLSDPVFTLLWLYLSGRAPPEPSLWGPDPTYDILCCEETGGCS